MDVDISILKALLEKLTHLEARLRELNADNRVVVATIHEHGTFIARLEKTVEQLKIRCPLLKLETSEFNKIND